MKTTDGGRDSLLVPLLALVTSQGHLPLQRLLRVSSAESGPARLPSTCRCPSFHLVPLSLPSRKTHLCLEHLEVKGAILSLRT